MTVIRLCEFNNGRGLCRDKATNVFEGKHYCVEHYERFHCFKVGKPYMPKGKQENFRDTIMINHEGIGI